MDNKFCCDRMYREILDFKNQRLTVYNDPFSYIWYDEQYRRYHLFHYSGDWNDISGISIDYCPFCGTKLPRGLRGMDMEPFLRKEYGWTDDDCWGHPMRELPEEFKTDEWWKKRGL